MARTMTATRTAKSPSSADPARRVEGSETALDRFRSVHPPRATMGREQVKHLTDRQRELLDELGPVFEDGFADLNMASLAKRLNCSLRTLYALAPSRDKLVLTVVDRHLRHIGREARDVITDNMSALDALAAYLHASTRALAGTSDAFARDLATVDTVEGLISSHTNYVYRVARALLDLAVDQGETPPIDTTAIAITLAGLGWEFTRPSVKRAVPSSPKDAADTVIDVMIGGLRARSSGRGRSTGSTGPNSPSHGGGG
jgi:AcrR family transcriptional regulator